MKGISAPILAIILILVSMMFLLYFIKQSMLISDQYYCEVDEDCVPEQCCHPSSCINRAYAPNCKGVICSMECRPGTMDCGQGYCACIKNKCQAVITGGL